MEAMRKQQAAFADFVGMEGLDDDSDLEDDNVADGKTSTNEVFFFFCPSFFFLS